MHAKEDQAVFAQVYLKESLLYLSDEAGKRIATISGETVIIATLLRKLCQSAALFGKD